MKRILQMSVTLKIYFEYDPEKIANLNEAMNTAVELASQPNMHTIESGVQLLQVDKVNYILK